MIVMRLILLICVCLLPSCKRELQSHEPRRGLPTSVGDWRSTEVTSEECGIESGDRIHSEYRRFERDGHHILVSLATGQFPYLLMHHSVSTRYTPVYYESVKNSPAPKLLKGEGGVKVELTTLLCEQVCGTQRSDVAVYWSIWDGVRWVSPRHGDGLERLLEHVQPVSKLYVIAPVEIEPKFVHEFLVGLCELHSVE